METAATYTKKISYSQEFLTGSLAGICIRQTMNTTDDAVHMRLNALMGATKLNPRTDLTGNTYWIYNIGCEDIR